MLPLCFLVYFKGLWVGLSARPFIILSHHFNLLILQIIYLIIKVIECHCFRWLPRIFLKALVFCAGFLLDGREFQLVIINSFCNGIFFQIGVTMLNKQFPITSVSCKISKFSTHVYLWINMWIKKFFFKLYTSYTLCIWHLLTFFLSFVALCLLPSFPVLFFFFFHNVATINRLIILPLFWHAGFCLFL